MLLADDDDMIASLVEHRLSREGFAIERVANGDAAMDATQAGPVALVILDVKMPGLDGFEVLARLRKLPAFAQTPIVMLTALGSERDVVRAFDLGADDYVMKPFSPQELSARVRRLLARGRHA